jgi:CDP-diacylglycerol--serine O-phosphatidyltransferase
MVGDFYKSSILIICCIVFDSLDGLAARALNAQTSLGKELDSLADLVSFGIAPAYLYYLLSPFSGLVSYLIPCFLIIGSALRLAKFNIVPSSDSFSGLPTPATAFFFIGLYFSYHYESDFVLSLLENKWVYFFLPVFFCFMMLSNLSMFSMKGMNKNVWTNKYQIAQLSIFIALLFVDYKIAIPVSVLTYILLSAIQSIALQD